MERTITVRGVGNISAKPDFIVIEMDIRGQSKNYSEALADASSAVEAVCNAAVSAGHSKDALKTINFGVSSEYDSVRNSKGTYQRVFVGYNCSYNTRLSFDFDRDMLERTLNAIAESKAEPELSIRFTVRDGSAVKSALLKAAAEKIGCGYLVHDAAELSSSREIIKNASELLGGLDIFCRASGVELGRLLTVNYDWSEIDLISPTGYAIERASLKRSAAVPDCIEPEDIKVRDTVAFVWEIV